MSNFKSFESWNCTAGIKRNASAKTTDFEREIPIFFAKEIMNIGKKLPQKINRNDEKESPKKRLPLVKTVSVAAGRIPLRRTPVASKFLIVKKYSVDVSQPRANGKKWCKKLCDVTAKKTAPSTISSAVILVF